MPKWPAMKEEEVILRNKWMEQIQLEIQTPPSFKAIINVSENPTLGDYVATRLREEGYAVTYPASPEFTPPTAWLDVQPPIWKINKGQDLQRAQIQDVLGKDLAIFISQNHKDLGSTMQMTGFTAGKRTASLIESTGSEDFAVFYCPDFAPTLLKKTNDDCFTDVKYLWQRTKSEFKLIGALIEDESKE